MKKGIAVSLAILQAAILAAVGACSPKEASVPPGGPAAAVPPAAPALARAGLRASSYGVRGAFPGIEYWMTAVKSMAARFPGATPSFVWLVSTMDSDRTDPENHKFTGRTKFTFPADGKDVPNAVFAETDVNEPYLKAFDEAGFKVWLQVEPALADTPTLIDLVLSRYGKHPCVIGLGIDVEWNKWTEKDNEGVAVTDEEARAWSERVRSYNPAYLLFLKHWTEDKMPPAYREGLAFINDSQIFKSLDEMLADFSGWARAFAPSPVGFQFGYPADREWWSKLQDPPADIGRAILAAAPNTAELYWVDFTVTEIWPLEAR